MLQIEHGGKKWGTSRTFVVEVLQVAADVDADVLHLHVLQAGELVHVLQQAVVLTRPWAGKDINAQRWTEAIV